MNPEILRHLPTDYAQGKRLLAQIPTKYCSSPFWELVRLFFGSDSSSSKETSISEWLSQTVVDCIPEPCDPFLRALFTNDKEQAISLSSSISPFLPLLLTSQFRATKYDAPGFLLAASFQYGEALIPGKVIWELINGDIKVFDDYHINWIQMFSLYLWYFYPNLDIKTSFLSFSQVFPENHLDDPTYCLLAYEYGHYPSLSPLLSLLDPLNAYVLQKVLESLDHAVDAPSTAIELRCAAYFDTEEHWEYMPLVLSEPSRQLSALHKHCSPIIEVTDREASLVGIFTREQLLDCKAQRCLEEIPFTAGGVNQLYHSAIVLYSQIGAYDRCVDLYVNHMLPAVFSSGTDTELFLSLHDTLFADDSSDELVAIGQYKAIYNCQNLDYSQLDRIKELLLSGFGTFAFRRSFCTLLLALPDTVDACRDVDAVPKALLYR